MLDDITKIAMELLGLSRAEVLEIRERLKQEGVTDEARYAARTALEHLLIDARAGVCSAKADVPALTVHLNSQKPGLTAGRFHEKVETVAIGVATRLRTQNFGGGELAHCDSIRSLTFAWIPVDVNEQL